MTLGVTVLRCRRCEKMCNTKEVNITNLNQRNETWRCLDCGGVCDAVDLVKPKRKPTKEQPKRGRNRKSRTIVQCNEFLNVQSRNKR